MANLVSNRSLNPFSTKIGEKSQFLTNLWQTERFQHSLPTMCYNWVLNQGLKPQLRFATWACNYCLAIWWETCGLEIRFARGGNGVSNCIVTLISAIERYFSLHNPHYRKCYFGKGSTDSSIITELYLEKKVV